MIFIELHRVSTISYRFPSIFIDFHRFSLIFIDFQSFSIDFELRGGSGSHPGVSGSFGEIRAVWRGGSGAVLAAQRRKIRMGHGIDLGATIGNTRASFTAVYFYILAYRHAFAAMGAPDPLFCLRKKIAPNPEPKPSMRGGPRELRAHYFDRSRAGPRMAADGRGWPRLAADK